MAKHFFNSFQDESSRLQMLFRIGFFNISHNFIEKRFNAGVFLQNLRNFEKHLILQNTSGDCCCQDNVSYETMKLSDIFRGVKKKHWLEMG